MSRLLPQHKWAFSFKAHAGTSLQSTYPVSCHGSHIPCSLGPKVDLEIPVISMQPPFGVHIPTSHTHLAKIKIKKIPLTPQETTQSPLCQMQSQACSCTIVIVYRDILTTNF